MDIGIKERIEFIKNALNENKKIIQITTFNITGLAIYNILKEYNLNKQIKTIFIDTLHHFSETYDMLKDYPDVFVIKPKCANSQDEFTKKYGFELWKRQPERYLYYTKVQPLIDIYQQFKPDIVINGRRKSQDNERSKIDLYELDSYDSDITKMQLLYDLTELDVVNYLKNKNVDLHPLYESGYKSIGDYHSTIQSINNVERSGREFYNGKTECGLHQNIIKDTKMEDYLVS